MRFTETLTAPTIEELNAKYHAFRAEPRHHVLERIRIRDLQTGEHSVQVLYEDGRKNANEWTEGGQSIK